LAVGQSNQEWIAIKQKCGIPASTAYNDWVAAGSKCNSGSAAPGTGSGSAEQLGTDLGNMGADLFLKGVHNLFNPTPARTIAPPNPAQDPRVVAARQLNNSGIYLLNRKPRDFAGAINEFQKALQETPNDSVIAENLRYAKRLQKESVSAGQTSSLLGGLLGEPAALGAASGNPLSAGATPNLFNSVNLDPNVVDFRGMFRNSLPTTGNSYLPAANVNALHAVLTGSDSSVVDLSHASTTSVDPKSVQTQINTIFGRPVAVAVPKPPEAKEQIKGQIQDLFPKPDSPPHN
jgi:hypothetical protein